VTVRPQRCRPAGARGAVLFLCLVVLLVLGVLGGAAVETSVLEVRLARNQQDVQTAFQAAEAALRQGEAQAAALDLEAIDAGTGSWRPAAPEATGRWRDPAVWHGRGTGASGTGRYLIEHLASVEEEAFRLVVFRVTARGVGSRADVPVLLQTTYGRVWPLAGSAGSADEGFPPGLRAGRLSWRELEG